MQITYERTLIHRPRHGAQVYVVGLTFSGQHAGILWGAWGVPVGRGSVKRYCGLLFNPTHWMYRNVLPQRLAHAIDAGNVSSALMWHNIPGTYTQLYTCFWGICGIPLPGRWSATAYCVKLCDIVAAHPVE